MNFTQIEDHNYRQKYFDQLKKVQGIQIQALPLYDTVPYLLNIDKGETLEMPVLFRILVGDHSHLIKRRPIHICLVLDRSGSMIGDPLNYCKKAIKQVIAQLSTTDLVSLVSYDDRVETVFERQKPDNYNQLSQLVDGIIDGGYTNISSALFRAAEILNTKDKGTQYQKIVFLFSDGEANRGITNLDQLGTFMSEWVEKNGIHFSSFGIGVHYNEKWMRSIARGGEGNYFFIDNVESIPSLVEKGLTGFTQLIGEKVNFKVSGLNGHQLTSLQNDRKPQTLLNGRNLTSIRSLGLYQFLSTVKLQTIPSCDKKRNINQDVLEYQLSFNPLPGLEYLSPQKGSVSVKFVDGELINPSKKNLEVVCYLTIGECAKLNHQVDQKLAKRNIGQAIELKKQIIDKYQQVLQFDLFGVIGALLEREKQTLKLIQQEGDSARCRKSQEYTSSIGYTCTTSAPTPHWETQKTKITEEECDLTYSLFN